MLALSTDLEAVIDHGRPSQIYGGADASLRVISFTQARNAGTRPYGWSVAHVLLPHRLAAWANIAVGMA